MKASFFYLSPNTEQHTSAGSQRGVSRRAAFRPFTGWFPAPSPTSAIFLAVVLFLGGMAVAIATGQLDGAAGQQVAR